ncbi:DUF4349 domain-containing protein [Anaerocolumna sedimenticola]|uniref:DUF4349 domain-containing protein n=1 Tax=Anaerocolumna sedimenticola TaxID=2696063 RepID=A0A6P1TQ19_9FIRM|nr:DUF4349 domain-containing protein [Anaerocolumna sedimenticola]QHQ63340.1 DUF4349 domain-containing protein [Anaerocolumna sedimenticola]
MHKGKSFKTIFFFIVFTLITACSSKNETSENQLNRESGSPDVSRGTKTEMNYDTSTGITSDPDSGEEPDDTAGKDSVSTNRKLIRRISMDLETLEFKSTLDLIAKEVNTSGGYIEKSEIQGSGYEERGNRYANLVIRIPKSEVDSFINLVDKNTNVINKQESIEDITLNYVDTESHVKALEIEQERLLSLLEKAGKLEDIITLEDRLSDVRYELEKYASTLRTYDNLVEYSTVTLTVNEVVRITPAEGKNAWDRMGTGLRDSLYNIRNGFINFIVWFVVNGPYIIIWGIILVILALIGIKINKKYNKTLQNPPAKIVIPQESDQEKEPDK